MVKPERPTGASAGHRAVRLSPGPSISVVMVCGTGRASLESSLEALLQQVRNPAAEIVVVRAGSSASECEKLEAAYPAARFLFAPSETPLSRLRMQGMEAAVGDIVVFIDERRPLPRELIARLKGSEREHRHVLAAFPEARAGERLREQRVDG